MKTPHADEYFAQVAHPITPHQMRTFVVYLVRDNALDQARELAGVMVAWGHRAPGDADFYYWLGVEQMLRALAEGAMDRWRERSDRKTKRQIAKVDAAIAGLGKVAS